MNVKELKQLIPLSEAYEIDESSRYLISIPQAAYSIDEIRSFAEQLRNTNLKAVLMVSDGITFYHLEDDEPVSRCIE